MAQSDKHPPLDFGSGHDLTVHGFEPRVGLCANREEPSWDSLSAPPPFPLSLFLKINKQTNKEEEKVKDNFNCFNALLSPSEHGTLRRR